MRNVGGKLVLNKIFVHIYSINYIIIVRLGYFELGFASFGKIFELIISPIYTVENHLR